MKKIVIVCMLLLGANIMAQPGDRRERMDRESLTAEQLGTLQAKKATLVLDLSDAQQKQIKALFIENAKLRKSKLAERKRINEGEERKKLTADERYKRANEKLDHQIAQKEELKKILSEEQYAKWQQMQKRKGKQLKEMRGKGMRGKKRKGKGNQR